MTAYPFRLDGFMDYLYEKNAGRGEELLAARGNAWRALRDEKRSLLRRGLGLDKLEAMAVPVKTEQTGLFEADGLTVRAMSMEILPRLTMPFYIVEAAVPRLDRDGSKKAVLYSHGHGQGGVLDCLVQKTPQAYHKNIPIAMAKRGYTVYMYEPAAFGDFKMENYVYNGDGACYPAATQLLMHGITLAGLRVFQSMRLADYMEEHGVRRYAAAGISGGGMVTSLYAALDDRISAVVVSSYASLYRECAMAMHHCVDNFIPNIFDIGEMPYVISLAIPKPLYVASGARDPIFPVEGVRKGIAILEALYAKHAGPELFTAEIFDGIHEYTEGFIGWLDGTL